MRAASALAFAAVLLATASVCVASETGSQSTNTTEGPWRPVVVMHGIKSNAIAMELVVSWIEDALPGVYVKNVEIGNGVWDSIFLNMNDQVAEFCAQLAADDMLRHGFNIIGYSQGTLVTRGYIERCSPSENGPHNYIAWDGPQAGQFGTPFINVGFLDELVASTPYDPFVQHTVSFANYWKDPFNRKDYIAKSIFLADVNNERETSKNATYRDNIARLNTMVLLDSTVDRIIVPYQSGQFGYYPWGNISAVVPLRDTLLYKNDDLALKTLDAAGKLKMYTTKCHHAKYITKECKNYFTEFTLPHIQNRLPPSASLPPVTPEMRNKQRQDNRNRALLSPQLTHESAKRYVEWKRQRFAAQNKNSN